MAVVVVDGQYRLELETQHLNYGAEAAQVQVHVVANIQFKVQVEVRMQFVL
jgi:hypothetical protein